MSLDELHFVTMISSDQFIFLKEMSLTEIFPLTLQYLNLQLIRVTGGRVQWVGVMVGGGVDNFYIISFRKLSESK